MYENLVCDVIFQFRNNFAPKRFEKVERLYLIHHSVRFYESKNRKVSHSKIFLEFFTSAAHSPFLSHSLSSFVS